MYDGRSTASLSLIESLTTDRDALAQEISALREREQLYHMLLGQLVPPHDEQRWQRMCLFEAILVSRLRVSASCRCGQWAVNCKCVEVDT